MSPFATIAEHSDARVPRIVVAVSHPTMRRYVCDLIEQGCRCWLATATNEPAQLRNRVATLHPDVIVLEASRFPDCLPDVIDSFPVGRVVVIGPYANDDARLAGAGAWISHDRLPTDLVPALHGIVDGSGCSCHPETPVASTKEVTS